MLNKTISNVCSLIKIKSLFQINDKIGKVSSVIPLMMSRFIELLFTDLLNQVIHLATTKNKKRLKKKHLLYIIKKKERFRELKKS